MSERKEHKRRYNLRLEYIAHFQKWLNDEPPMWRLFKWHRWKQSKPIMPKRVMDGKGEGE